MLKHSKVALALLALLGIPSLASATLVTFEGLADATNINGLDLGGVTVTNPSGHVDIFANGRFGVSYHSAVNAIGSFTGAASNNPMVFTFDAPQSIVSLWGGDVGGDTDNWTLNAYDAVVGGNLVDTGNSGDYNGNPYRQISVSAATIWRVEAVWNGPDCCGVGYDDIGFTAVPEPTTLTFLGLGLAGLGLRKRRATRHQS